MRHRVKKGRKLGRNSGQRLSLMRNLLTTLIEFGHLVTTVAKAKEVKREFDLLVNRAKRAESSGNYSLKRKIFSFLTRKEIARKLFSEVLPRLADRTSGYLTLVKTGSFRNDAAEKVLLKFVKEDKHESKKDAAPSPKEMAPTRRKKRTSGETRREN